MAGLRSRLSGSVPISIGVHLFLLLCLLIVPLTATLDLPDPAAHLPDYMLVAPPPPPAARVPASAVNTARAAAAPNAPVSAPDTIRTDTTPPVPEATPDTGTPTPGIPEGLGVLAVGRPTIPVLADPPRQAGPVRLADLPVSPRKIVDARPLYPDIARSARVQGTIIMEAVLDTNGRVTQLRVLQSVPLLDQAAIDAVRQWRYTPSLYGGRPVSVLMTITVRFTLQ
ncbi:MAG: energy transducer TonB [Vicinamibacterales bacterium]